MKFNVIESRSIDQYTEFVDMYNQRNVSKSQILEKLGIGGHQYNKYYKRAKENNDLTCYKGGRPRKGFR